MLRSVVIAGSRIVSRSADLRAVVRRWVSRQADQRPDPAVSFLASAERRKSTVRLHASLAASSS